jgi:DNA-binding transcriptional MerR regulator
MSRQKFTKPQKALMMSRTRELRKEGFSYRQIVNILEREGLLVATPASWATLRNMFNYTYPSQTGLGYNQVAKIKPRKKKQVREIFIKHLKDMGYNAKEIESELNRLIK